MRRIGDGSPLVSTGNATADAIRAAQLGNVFGHGDRRADRRSVVLAGSINPSYQLTDDVLLYASARAGEKSGSVQFDTADGSPQNVRPEQSLNFEVGVKSSLLRPQADARTRTSITRASRTTKRSRA